jgi:hypothetical protein
MRTINGAQIVELKTINSMYANGCIIAILDDDTEVRIPVNKLLPLMDGICFNIEKKKVHEYVFDFVGA